MRVLTILILCLPSILLTQNNKIIRIDSLPTEGVLLDKGWKFSKGDNLEWSKTTFNDSTWASIDPTKDIMDLPQIQDGKIGWLRLNIKMDTSLLAQPHALTLVNAVATEIYIDGQLIERFGKLDSSHIQAHYTGYPTIFTPISLPKNQSNITIAVRFAMQKGLPYNRYANGANYLFNSTIVPIEEIVNNSNNVKRQIMLCFSKVGAFCILFILHIAFFVFYPPQKANLYFSGMALSFAVFNFMWGGFLAFYPIENLTLLMYGGLIRVPIYTLGYILLVRAFYTMYDFKIDFVYWTILGGNILIMIASYYDYYEGVQDSEFYTVLLSITGSLYITFKAILAKKRNAQLILLGFVFSIVALSIRFLVDYYALLPGYKFSFFTHFCDFIGQISIPISISWFLGSDFAFTSKILQQKLVEVQELSKEKQHLLAVQNETLEKQIQERTAELSASQNQLIQSEKLASLGELTAGISHEIQNPLNFVNNFSELSVDLAAELDDEFKKPELDRDLIADLIKDIRSNQEKINNHGKRASSIVKGMLEHSRTSTGVRELTDINKLADEYLRLSYHGLRAKDKNFNADFKTEFDENLPKIEIIPQDIGRVLLNLINNAFYASLQKEKLNINSNYKPKVTVTTIQLSNQITIKVLDNGTGMSESVRAKVFQPFFTTKPTGQGTGLGLSLAYDIVTKGHGGTLEVESTEGVGTEFKITLPIQ